jgi:16S rRNA processing protein RimM
MQLVTGRIARPHGVRGEVIVEVRTDDPDLRFAPGSVVTKETAVAGPLTIAQARWHSGRLLVQFKGYEDRNVADELRGVLLLVDSADLEDVADPDEFRDHQLIGLAVSTVSGEPVGTVADVLHHGQDLLVVSGSGTLAGSQIMIPFVAPLVPVVDLKAGLLQIDPPPGLLDPEAAV